MPPTGSRAAARSAAYAGRSCCASGEGESAKECLIDVKEAAAAAAPRQPDARMPRDNAARVVAGARALSPNLGERMMAARVLGRGVVLRELLPQDLKLEIDRMGRKEAMELARYLAGVVGRAHGRQMDPQTRQAWLAELALGQSSRIDAPHWLWSSVVDLMGLHEMAYLDHCRRRPPWPPAPREGSGAPAAGSGPWRGRRPGRRRARRRRPARPRARNRTARRARPPGRCRSTPSAPGARGPATGRPGPPPRRPALPGWSTPWPVEARHADRHAEGSRRGRARLLVAAEAEPAHRPCRRRPRTRPAPAPVTRRLQALPSRGDRGERKLQRAPHRPRLVQRLGQVRQILRLHRPDGDRGLVHRSFSRLGGSARSPRLQSAHYEGLGWPDRRGLTRALQDGSGPIGASAASHHQPGTL